MSLLRGKWKIGRVFNIYLGMDGRVWKVDVEYKNIINEFVIKYKGKGYISV